MADASQTNTQPARQLKSWDSIIADPQYQALDDAGKIAYAKRYEQAGGKAEKAGFLDNVGNAVAGAANSIQSGIVHGFTGAVEAADTGANKVSNFVSNSLGMGDVANPHGSDITAWAQGQRQQYDNAYDKRVADLKITPGGAFGLKYGQTIADVGAMVAAPEVAIPYMVGRTFGQSYGDQAPDAQGEKSFEKASTDAATTYLLSKVPGGKGLLKSLLPEAKTPVTRLAVGLIDTGEKSAVGGGVASGGGYVSEVNDALNKGDTLTEANRRGVERAKEDFATGAVFGAGAHVVPRIPGMAREVGTAAKSAITGRSEPAIHPDLAGMNAKIKTEVDNIDNPAHTPEQRQEAYNTSPNKRANDTINTFNDYGFKPNAQMARTAEEQAVLGVTPKQANKSVADNKAQGEQYRTSMNEMDGAISSANRSNADLQKGVNQQLKGSAEQPEATNFFEQHKRIQQYVNDGDYKAADAAALRAQNHFNNLSPDTQALINQNWITPKGFGSTVDPIGYSKRLQDVVTKRAEVEANIKNGGGKIPDPLENVPGLARGIMNAKTAGGAEAVSTLVRGANLITGAVRRRTQANTNRAAQERQASLDRTQETPNQPNANLGEDFTKFGAKRAAESARVKTEQWHKDNDALDADLKSSVNTSTINTPHVRTVENVQKFRNGITDKKLAQQVTPSNFNDGVLKANIKKLDKTRQQFTDKTLADQLTVDNINDVSKVRSLKSQDAAQDITRVNEAVKSSRERKANRLKAEDVANTEQLNSYRRESGSYHSPEVWQEAQQMNTRGGRIANPDKVIADAIKLSSKASKGSGSKEEFHSYVDNLPNMDKTARDLIKKRINEFYSNTPNKNNGRLTPEQEKHLYKNIGDAVSDYHKFHGNKTAADDFAGSTKARIEAVDKRVASEAKAIQVSDMDAQLRASFRDKNIPEHEIDDWIANYSRRIYKNGARSEAAHKSAIEAGKKAAVKYASEYHGKSLPEREESVTDVVDELAAKDKETLSSGKPLNDEVADHVQDTIFKNLDKTLKPDNKFSATKEKVSDEVDTMREQVRYALRNNPARRDATLRSLDAIEKGLHNRIDHPNEHFSTWISQRDIRTEGANAYGLQSHAFEAITGKTYDKFGGELKGGEDYAAALAKANKAKSGGVLSDSARRKNRVLSSN